MRKHSKSIRMKRLILIVPIFLCTIVLLQVLFSTLIPILMPDSSVTPIDNGTALLEIIGIAISVWVGLNLYNVFSKEEINRLLDEAEEAAQATQIVFTETLLSKFRLSHLDNTSRYIEKRLRNLELLPVNILKKLLELEDSFYIAGKHCRHQVTSSIYDEGADASDFLLDMVNEFSDSGQLNREQKRFLIGYINLRKSDFLYYKLDVNSYKNCLEQKVACIKNIDNAQCLTKRAIYIKTTVQCLEHCLSFWFGIDSVDKIRDKTNYSEEEQQCIAFIAHSIGSTYIIGYKDKNSESPDEKVASLRAELKAKEFSENIMPDVYRSQVIRNLGVAFERAGQSDEALREYKLAYRLNRFNPKCAYCLGSWYRKKACVLATADTIDGIDVSQLPEDQKDSVIKDLTTSLFWHEKEYTLTHKQDDAIVQICKKLSEITSNNKYQIKHTKYTQEQKLIQ